MKRPDRMRLLEAIEVMPSDALLPVSWVRSLLAQARQISLTEHQADAEIGRHEPSGEAE